MLLQCMWKPHSLQEPVVDNDKAGRNHGTARGDRPALARSDLCCFRDDMAGSGCTVGVRSRGARGSKLLVLGGARRAARASQREKSLLWKPLIHACAVQSGSHHLFRLSDGVHDFLHTYDSHMRYVR